MHSPVGEEIPSQQALSTGGPICVFCCLTCIRLTFLIDWLLQIGPHSMCQTIVF